MNKIIAITWKNLKEAVRNWKSTAIVFVLPIVFMGIFAIAFGDNFEVNYEIALIEPEAGIEVQSEIETEVNPGVEESQNQEYEALKQAISEITQANSQEKLFTVTEYSEVSTAAEKVRTGEITAYITMGKSIAETEIVVSPRDQNTPAVIGIVREVVDGISQRQPSVLEVTTFGEDGEEAEGVPNAFQFLAPGLIIYGLIMMITQVAIEFAQIREKNQIFRYFTSKVSSWQLILGYFLYYVVIGSVQVSILIGSAILFGLEVEGNPLEVFAMAIPAVFFVIGTGLLIGGIVEKPDPASNVATIVGIILGFLSGAFLWTTRVEWLPTTQAAQGIIEIVQFGRSLHEVTDHLAAVLFGSLLMLVLGTLVFSFRQLRYIGG